MTAYNQRYQIDKLHDNYRPMQREAGFYIVKLGETIMCHRQEYVLTCVLLDPSSCSTIRQSWLVWDERIGKFWGGKRKLEREWICENDGDDCTSAELILHFLFLRKACSFCTVNESWYLTFNAPHRLHLYRPLANFCICSSIRFWSKVLCWSVLYRLFCSPSPIIPSLSPPLSSSILRSIACWGDELDSRLVSFCWASDNWKHNDDIDPG